MITSILDFLHRHRYLLYLCLTILTLLTLSLTLLPPDKISPDTRLFEYDKIGHGLMFGSWTFFLGFTHFVTYRKSLPLLSIFIAGCLFGISVEIMQELLPVNRNADPYDALADFIGCLIAVILLKIITSQASFRQKPWNPHDPKSV